VSLQVGAHPFHTVQKQPVVQKQECCGQQTRPLLQTAVTFPAAEHHCPLACIKLYCLVTKAYGCKQLAQSCYPAMQSQVRCHNHYTSEPPLPVMEKFTMGQSNNLYFTPILHPKLHRKVRHCCGSSIVFTKNKQNKGQ